MSSASVRAFAPQPAALSNSIVRRNCEMRRVDCGQWRSAPLERGQMLLIGEARHRVVGLRLEMGAGDAPLRRRAQHRQAAAADQIVDERGDEDGLAGARQARHAEPQASAREIIGERTRHDARFEGQIGEDGQGKPWARRTPLSRTIRADFTGLYARPSRTGRARKGRLRRGHRGLEVVVDLVEEGARSTATSVPDRPAARGPWS